MSITEALAIAAPFYNLAMVIIVILLFSKLFNHHPKNAFLKPWYFMFAAVMVFILEEVITILRAAGIVNITLYINVFFDLVIFSLFIYTLLLVKEQVK